MKKEKIAFGIPFKASKFTQALQLCLYSIQKFASEYDYTIYLLADVTNVELASDFPEGTLKQQFPHIIIKHYKRSRIGDYTQALADWVIFETDAKYAIFLHSDVYFTDCLVLTQLLQPLKQNHDISGWEVPFCRYESTFHLSENNQKRFYIAPRICTWLFAVNCTNYRSIGEITQVFWLGNYHVQFLKTQPFPTVIDQNDFLKWLSSDSVFTEMKKSGLTCLIDIGTFARYFSEKGCIKFFCLGKQSNPNFDSMEIKDYYQGFIHIEQFDPERFDDKFYSSEFLKLRVDIVRNICSNFTNPPVKYL